MENTLVNPDFERAIRQLRRMLPMLSFGLLIGTYLVSALIMVWEYFTRKMRQASALIILAILTPYSG